MYTHNTQYIHTCHTVKVLSYKMYYTHNTQYIHTCHTVKVLSYKIYYTHNTQYIHTCHKVKVLSYKIVHIIHVHTRMSCTHIIHCTYIRHKVEILVTELYT